MEMVVAAHLKMPLAVLSSEPSPAKDPSIRNHDVGAARGGRHARVSELSGAFTGLWVPFS